MLIGGATRTLCYLVLISVAYCGIGHCTSRHYLRVTITLLLTRPVHWSGASRWGGLKFTSQYKRWLRAKSRCTVQVEEMVEGKERASGEGFPYTVASVGPTPCTVASGSGWPLRKAYSSSQPSMVNWLSSPTFPCLFVCLSRYGNTWPNLHFSTKYQPVLPSIDPEPPRTDQYHPLLTQCHPTSTVPYWPSNIIYHIQMSDFPLSAWHERSCTLD